MSASETVPAEAVKRQVKKLPPFRVVLHNDDVNTAEDVVYAIVMIVRMDPPQAFTRMHEAHTTGASVLLVTHRERAELYVEQFATYNLTVTAEPDV